MLVRTDRVVRTDREPRISRRSLSWDYRDKDGRRHYTIGAIPYQNPQQEAERLKAVHEARVKIVPKV